MDLVSWNLGFTRGERNRPADVVLADGICRQSYQNGYDAARRVKVENLACNGNTPDKVAADRRRARYLRGIGQ